MLQAYPCNQTRLVMYVDVLGDHRAAKVGRRDHGRHRGGLEGALPGQLDSWLASMVAANGRRSRYAQRPTLMQIVHLS
jgi:hypothetical protein